MRRTMARLVDDLDGGPADETIFFGLDGLHYEIDLSDDHARQMRHALARYVEVARRCAVTGGAAPRARTNSGGWAQTDSPVVPEGRDEHLRMVRAWAAGHGYPMAARGRVPGVVIAAYHAGDPSMLSVPAR